ncbi:hypothetical protein ABMA27_004907 [Loxostege sticticalis]|uniref:Reverse transcriptase n=1 Tax=Loxostege sticticalis TaxID=481309 RepID=A0ABR3HL22_LOXSC
MSLGTQIFPRVPPSGEWHPGSHLVVSGTRIEVGDTLKYLGLTLDGRWSFRAHFQKLAPKLLKTAGALSRLMPNLGGPSSPCRRLYMGVVRSMALYGAPVWYAALSRENKLVLRRAQRHLAVRVVRGYRTVSAEAALALAGSMPWDLDALILAAVHKWRGDQRSQGQRPAPREIDAERLRLEEDAVARWRERLDDSTYGRRTTGAIAPVLTEWAIVARMASSEEAWQAVLTFCEAVISQKEAAEREREADPTAPMIRRKRLGRRRRNYHLHLPLPDGSRTTDTGVSPGPATAPRVTPRAVRCGVGGIAPSPPQRPGGLPN